MNASAERSAAPGSKQYRVADLLIDAGRQRVTRADAEIPLPKLSFDLLLALVRAAPDLLSHDQLMAQVWPGLVVSPETVSQRVKLLRDALGDDPHQPRYIAGLRGRGYRIVAPITHIGPITATQEIAEAQPPQPEQAVPRSTSTRRHWTVAASLAALIMLAATTAIVWIRTHSSSRTASTPTPSVTVSALPERTVAVLPFENLSGQAPDEFVALGISEGVLHRLAAIRDLTLIARSSSFAFRGKSVDARDIGLKLNARYLVEGSVQRAGDRLRVTAQLIDAATGAHVWSLRFDRTIDDIFAMEDEISHSVARALEVSLRQDPHPYARFGTDAYLASMQGRALIATRKVADAEQAIERFQRAVELAPSFAAAHVALADAYVYLARLNDKTGSSSAVTAAANKAESILAHALQLDPALGEAYVLRADLESIKGDTTGALADYRKGLELSPNYGTGYEHLADFLSQRGQIDEALVAIDKARLVDPLSPRNHYLKGLILRTEGSTQEAETLFLQTLQIAPDFHPALTRLAAIRAYSHGRYAEAVKLAEHAVALDPRTVWTLTRPVHFYLEMQDVDAARSFAVQQPESARAALWVPICLYERQPQRAADILRANQDRWSDGLSEDIEAYVIRDAALASGRLAEAAKELPRLPSDAHHNSYSMVALAQLKLALGDKPEAEKLARKVLSMHPARSDPVARAIALMLLAENQVAIDELERNPRGYWGRWWYTFEREPAFEPVRNDPRFQELATRARANALAQRRLLDQMRSRGEVPTRAASAKARLALC